MSEMNATLGKCWSGGGSSQEKEWKHLGLESAAGRSPLLKELSASQKTAESPTSPAWAFLSFHPKLTLQKLGILLAYIMSFHPLNNIY